MYNVICKVKTFTALGGELVEKNMRIAYLYDFYGEILSEKQQLLYLEIICAVMLIAIVVYIAVTPYTLYNNTLSVCFVFSLIPLLCMIEKFSGVSITGHLKWIIPVSIFLITVNGLAAVKSGCYDINNNYDAVSEDIISQSFN